MGTLLNVQVLCVLRIAELEECKPAGKVILLHQIINCEASFICRSNPIKSSTVKQALSVEAIQQIFQWKPREYLHLKIICSFTQQQQELLFPFIVSVCYLISEAALYVEAVKAVR